MVPSKNALSESTSLDELLRLIVTEAEDARPGMLASILLLSSDNAGGGPPRLRLACAPNVPRLFSEAIDGLEIGPQVGACGAAAYTRQRVIVPDVFDDERWRDYRDLAEQSGLRACWSQPIFSPSHEILGTLAMYFREPKSPSDDDLALLEHSAQLAGVVIDRSRTTDELVKSEERLRLALRATNDAIWDLDVVRDRLWSNERFVEDFGGLSPDESAATWWQDHVHPDDLARTLSSQANGW